MIVSYNWLKEYVDIPWPARQLGEKLSLAGLDVDRIENLGEKWNRIIVAEILRISQHPQIPSLLVCDVATGRETISLVCGASNIKEKDKVPLALPGTLLPNQKRIEKSVIHGVESSGMLCSEAELELGTDATGIMILDQKSKAGESLTLALHLEDWVLELDLTPNRPDCLSLYGVAREISALSGQPLRKVTPRSTESKVKAVEYVQVELENSADCPRYAAKIIRHVKVKPSPSWLARKLYSVGQRPINNIVDLTNFVMLELGQPLHAFDYDLFSQKKVLVRRAKQGEEFVTLDRVKRKLSSDILLITDGKKPVALAGIMGGQESEVSQSTKNILLESAYFNPRVIRPGRKKLGLSTEASARFEKGADPNMVGEAAERAAALIAEAAEGEVLQGTADQYPQPILPRTIIVRPERVNQLLDTNLPTQEMVKILQGLQFSVKENETLQVAVPTFRPDLTLEADLIEEIARIYGYQQIPVASQNRGVLEIKESREETLFRQIREKLTGWGFQEVVTNSLVDPKKLELFGDSCQPIALLNPITLDQSVLRTNLALSMLQVVLTNQNRQQYDLKLFEIGKIYQPKDSTPQESFRLCLALCGNRYLRNWDRKPEPVDFYDLKGAIQNLAEALGLAGLHLICVPEPSFSSSYSFKIEASAGTLGRMGLVREQILNGLDLKNEVYLAEIELDKVISLSGADRQFQSLPKYPPVDRDLAIMVDKNTPAWEIVEKIKTWAGGLAEEVGIFDVYQGQQVPPDKKSLAFYIRYRSAQKTLTEPEVNQVQEKIIKNLEKQFNAQLRS